MNVQVIERDGKPEWAVIPQPICPSQGLILLLNRLRLSVTAQLRWSALPVLGVSR